MSAPDSRPPAWLADLRFDAQGLIPAIAQDAASGQVLMVAWMDVAAVQETVRTGQAVYYSRSRQRLWRKGERSGHVQQVHDIRLDCDGDVLLLQVHQAGGMACHTGRARCFYRQLQAAGGAALPAGDGATPNATGVHWASTDPVLKDPAEIYGAAPAHQPANQPAPQGTDATLARLADTLASRHPARGGDPATSYTARLLAKGPDAYLKKIGEEATELVMAVKDGQPERVVAETADLWFHCLVALSAQGLRPEDVLAELARREGLSGLAEKAARPKG